MKAKLLFLFAIFVFIPSLSFGQGNCYSLDSISYNPYAYTAGQNITLSDDIHSGIIPIGFSFCFFGNTYDSIVISSNGYVTFDLTQANQYSTWSITSAIPDTNLPMNSIMGPFQDINPGANGQVSYRVVGLAPYRKFIISYYQVAMFSCTNMAFSNQIVLHETTNYIDVFITDKPLCSSWNNGVAIEGLHNIDGTEAYIVPGRNYPTQWTAANDGYRFKPQCWCAGNPAGNSIEGVVYNDINMNCSIDSGEVLTLPTIVCLNDTNLCIWTDPNGHYAFPVDTGLFAIISELPNNYFNYECPSNGIDSVYFNTLGNNAIINFGDTANVSCADLTVDAAVPMFWFGNSVNGIISYCNQGPITATNTTITMVATDSTFIIGSTVPYTYLGNSTYSFSIGNVPMGQCSSFGFTVGIDTSAIMGAYECLEVSIHTPIAECDTTNNRAIECHLIVGSFDPNVKEVYSSTPQSEGFVREDTITATQQLEYMIRFQNTGTAPAVTIVVRDTLQNNINPMTVAPGISSHPYILRREGNVLIWEFHDIFLPDSASDPSGSIGFLRFTIDQVSDNEPGDEIFNNCAIYFDYNAPVITNHTRNMIEIPAEPDGVNEVNTSKLMVYPNPTGDGFYLTSSETGNYNVAFIDLMGKTIRTESFTGNSHYFQRNGLANGVYLLDVRNTEGERVQTLRVAIK